MTAGAGESVGTLDGAWRRPSPSLATMRRAEVVAVALLVATAAGVIVGLTADATLGVVGGGGAILVGAAAERLVGRRVRSWAYCEREDDLLVTRGLLVRRLSVVPYGRMQFVDVTAGPIERSFGLATVKMHTAAAASDARIPGLNQPDAARLRDRLAELGEAKATGL